MRRWFDPMSAESLCSPMAWPTTSSGSMRSSTSRGEVFLAKLPRPAAHKKATQVLDLLAFEPVAHWGAQCYRPLHPPPARGKRSSV